MREDQGYQQLAGPGARPGGSVVGRAFAWVAGTLLLVAGLAASVFVFAALLVVAVVVGGYFWWKTRAVRQQLKAQMEAAQQAARERRPAGPAPAGAPQPEGSGKVIEGEVIRRGED